MREERQDVKLKPVCFCPSLDCCFGQTGAQRPRLSEHFQTVHNVSPWSPLGLVSDQAFSSILKHQLQFAHICAFSTFRSKLLSFFLMHISFQSYNVVCMLSENRGYYFLVQSQPHGFSGFFIFPCFILTIFVINLFIKSEFKILCNAQVIVCNHLQLMSFIQCVRALTLIGYNLLRNVYCACKQCFMCSCVSKENKVFIQKPK